MPAAVSVGHRPRRAAGAHQARRSPAVPSARVHLVVHPLPHLGPADLGGGGVLHQVVDRRGPGARQPRGQVAQADGDVGVAGPLAVIAAGGPARRRAGRAGADVDLGPLALELVRAGRRARRRTRPVRSAPGRGGPPRCRRSRRRPRAACPRSTLARAASVTSGLRRLGMNAAMPPMAWAPRRWQVLTSSSRVGAHERRRHRHQRRGRAARTPGRSWNRLATLKM